IAVIMVLVAGRRLRAVQPEGVDCGGRIRGVSRVRIVGQQHPVGLAVDQRPESVDRRRRRRGQEGRLARWVQCSRIGAEVAIDRVREAVRTGAGARLALPLNHAAYPRNAAQLKELGAGYTNCADPRNAPVALDAGAMRRLAQASGLRVAEPCGRLDSTVATPTP